MELDHFVLTVQDIDASVDFYTLVLGMEHIRFGQGRHALRYGSSKINLHPSESPIRPHARQPTPGSADLCFRTQESIPQVVQRLRSEGVEIELGPVARTGARGPIRSVYIRDPDGNLVEVAHEVVESDIAD